MKTHNSQLTTLSVVFLALFLVYPVAFAQEVDILYTGATHAMLYDCGCPHEPDGGVARRASLIKQLRKENPNSLLLDSGSFFAGGLMDSNTQDAALDKERTLVNLKAIELMKYDALAVGNDEFNLGRDFLEKAWDEKKIPMVSCNIKSDKIAPYVVKQVAGIKFGIVGLTPLSATGQAPGLEIVEPKEALKKAIEELKNIQKTDLIILLSQLGEKQDTELLKEIAGIDIVIVSDHHSNDATVGKTGSTLVLKPYWQARRLSKFSLTIKDKKIADFKIQDIRVSREIKEDPGILAFLPECFADKHCKKAGFSGSCSNPGMKSASCAYKKEGAVKLTVIVPKPCTICKPEAVITHLKAHFTGLDVSYLTYPSDKAAKNIVDDLGLQHLPAYILDKSVEQKESFAALKEDLELKNNYYLLKPRLAGISYFVQRQRIKGKFDLFISLYNENTAGLLTILQDSRADVHFLALEENGKFESAFGQPEVEEYLRASCVKKYYPQSFWPYLECRAKNIQSSWWEDCLAGADINKIKDCARGSEGVELLKENTALNKELRIMFGPTYLLENQEIFSSKSSPDKEELEKILKK